MKNLLQDTKDTYARIKEEFEQRKLQKANHKHAIKYLQGMPENPTHQEILDLKSLIEATGQEPMSFAKYAPFKEGVLCEIKYLQDTEAQPDERPTKEASFPESKKPEEPPAPTPRTAEIIPFGRLQQQREATRTKPL